MHKQNYSSSSLCAPFLNRNKLIAWKTNLVDEWKEAANLLLFSSSAVSVLSSSFLSGSSVLHSWLSDSNWVSSKSNLLTSETKSSHTFVLPESWARHLKATWKKIEMTRSNVTECKCIAQKGLPISKTY